MDHVIGIEILGDIETYNINCFYNAILDLALPKAQLMEKTSQKWKNEKKTTSHKKRPAEPNSINQLIFKRNKIFGDM